MVAVNLESTVGQLVRECPSRSRVFERLQIDYCCGGKVSLVDACRQRKIAADDVLKKLQDCESGSSGDNESFDSNALSLAELVDHIESTHHAYLKLELPRLDRMTDKVASVHGGREPRLRQLREIFLEFCEEIQPHMMKEERVLFPMIRKLELSAELPAFHCGALANPISQMELEHDHAGDALAKMRVATDGFVPPPWACNTYRAMLDGLAQLERDMHQHVHKENNVLFPKVLQLEAQRSAP